MSKIIKVYYRGGSTSSQKAITWFETYGIEIQKIKISRISIYDIIAALEFTDQGFEGLTKNYRKNKELINIERSKLDKMSFDEAVVYLKEQSILLRDPIILEGEKCLIGYNSDIIRQFFPKNYRRI